MKTFLFPFFLSVFILFGSIQAQGQDRNFGLGVQAGSPDGISLKNWISQNNAAAAVVSFNIRENGSTFYTHLDYLSHKNYDTPDWEIGRLSWYLGGGVGFIWRETGADNTFFFLRLPVGINFNFTDIPVDFYLETAPTFDVSPDFGFGFNSGFGFRYYLN